MTDQRLNEVLDQLQTLSDEEFEDWVFKQADSDEIAKELPSLFLTGNTLKKSKN
jgi:hypothetical protein